MFLFPALLSWRNIVFIAVHPLTCSHVHKPHHHCHRLSLLLSAAAKVAATIYHPISVVQPKKIGPAILVVVAIVNDVIVLTTAAFLEFDSHSTTMAH
jgi:hypothetical protein